MNGCSTPAACLVRLQIFNGSRSTRTEEEVIANSALQQEWRRLQGDSSAEAAAAEPSEACRPVEGDCPICYDEMQPGGSTLQVPEMQEARGRARLSLWMNLSATRL